MKLKDYITMCETLGLNPTPTKNARGKETGESYKTLSINDCILAIQEYYLNERKREGTYDKSIEFVLNMKSPMLALLLKNVKEETQEKIMDDKNTDWILEEKVNGNRQIIIFSSREKKFHFYSRNLSVTDFLPIDYADKILLPELNQNIIDRLPDFVLDCEVVPLNGNVTDERVVAENQLNIVSSILQYLPEESKHIQETNPLLSVAFDCLHYDGEDLFDSPLRERKETLSKLVQILKLAGFNIELVKSKPENMTKEDFYYSIVDADGEGVIAKNLNDTYDTLGRRDERWIKLKRSVQETMNRIAGMDSFDAFVSGFTLGSIGTKNENKIGALIFSVYLTDDNNQLLCNDDGSLMIHEIAQISGISDEQRFNLTRYDDDGKVMLNPRFFNQVASINGQSVTKELKLAHAVFDQWRYDRSFDTCKIKLSHLRDMVI